jgi:hypothetical protein
MEFNTHGTRLKFRKDYHGPFIWIRNLLYAFSG